ncbi:unnamed protein product [Paramecium sonneborni]|uniref:Uncharacterized protein n=1 Tax=Paramecium sonneborni TaxID=65129 RepID=A0A8S1RD53_9CILI|nr:unnamed protein product [Paramecium sonneborni]
MNMTLYKVRVQILNSLFQSIIQLTQTHVTILVHFKNSWNIG